LRERAASTRFAVLATIGPDGRPHLVPIVHAVVGDQVVTAVDDKPKSTRRLQRLENIRRDPRVTVLFDHRSEEWDDLWWVRADGVATLHHDRPADAAALGAKYSQYRISEPTGPWIWIEVSRWTGWSATS
jgi:PPOX class probable F420-dependent enzyme